MTTICNRWWPMASQATPKAIIALSNTWLALASQSTTYNATISIVAELDRRRTVNARNSDTVVVMAVKTAKRVRDYTLNGVITAILMDGRYLMVPYHNGGFGHPIVISESQILETRNLRVSKQTWLLAKQKCVKLIKHLMMNGSYAIMAKFLA